MCGVLIWGQTGTSVKDQGSHDWHQTMGNRNRNKGSVLRPRCIATERLEPSYYSILLYSTQLYSILFYCIPFYSILLYSTLLYSILFNCIPFYSILLHSTLFYSTLFYSILLYSALFYSTLFYSVLLYSTVFYSIPF